MRGEPPAPGPARDRPTGPGTDGPPFGGSWGRLYAVVLVTFGVVVALLGWLTWAYR